MHRVSVLACAASLAGCFSFAPLISFPDAGRADAGPQQGMDAGQPGADAGLPAAEACAVLNASRCAFLARCGLIEDSVAAQGDCAKAYETSWCGPLTWPPHVAKGALKYDPVRAQACAESFLTLACGEYRTLPDSCTRFLSPRVPLGQECYDGFTECLDGVCRGSSCPRTCQMRALLDEVCTSSADCRTNLYCKLSPFQPNVGQCTAYGAVGAACESDPQCADGLRCVSQQCRPLPPAGAGCLEGQCAEAAYCYTEGAVDGGWCLPRKLEGAPCARAECAPGLVCDPWQLECVRLSLGSGDACSALQKCPPGQICLGLTAAGPGLCHAPEPEGEPCISSGDCQAHLTCLEVDGGRSCARRLPVGASCSGSTECQSSAVCSQGQCVALPLPGQSCGDLMSCRWGLCRTLANDAGAVCGALLSAGQMCSRADECASGACEAGVCVARCVP